MLGCADELPKADEAPELKLKEVPHAVGEVTALETKQPPQASKQMKNLPLTIEQAVSLASEDLANRLGHKEFTLSEATAVTWPDASTGCPAPGYSYPQVLTRGYLIVLTDGAETFRYTGSARSQPELCPASRFRPPLDAHPDA